MLVHRLTDAILRICSGSGKNIAVKSSAWIQDRVGEKEQLFFSIPLNDFFLIFCGPASSYLIATITVCFSEVNWHQKTLANVDFSDRSTILTLLDLFRKYYLGNRNPALE